MAITIVVHTATRIVLMAGTDISAATINAGKTGWCQDYVSIDTDVLGWGHGLLSTASISIYEGVTLPAGFLPYCWTYSALGVWAQIDNAAVTAAVNAILAGSRQTVRPPTGLILTHRVYDYNSGTATRVDLLVTWAGSTSPGSLQYELQYRVVDGTWSDAVLVGFGVTHTIETVAANNYEVRVRARNEFDAVSTWLSTTTAVPLPDSTVPNVTGLELVGQGNNFAFVGRDITLGWNYVSPRADTDVSGPGRGSSWFRYYVIEVYTTGDVLRRTDYTTHERYIYSYEMNRADGAGTAIRNVKFSVRIMSAWGALSATAATITVTNPNIAKLSALALVGGINTLSVGLPQVSEPDFSGYDVHASQTTGFTPGAGNKINSGGPETVVTKINIAPGTWYVRAAGRDSFGSDGANFSDEYSVAVSSLVVTPAMLDGAARTDFFVRDTILYFDVAVLTWNAGYIDRGDHTYTLAAGTLAAANASYIIATFEDSGYTATLSKTAVTAGLPTLTANQSIIAVTSADATPQGNYYCYVRQANSVSIEGALVRDSTITNAKIADTIQSANWNPATNDGWKIDKAGNIQGKALIVDTVDADKIISGTELQIDTTYDSVQASLSVFVDSTTKGCVNIIGNDRNSTIAALMVRQGQKLGSPLSCAPAAAFRSDGDYGLVSTGGKGALRLYPSASSDAPTHLADMGALWVTSDGVLYINLGGGNYYTPGTNWAKVGAQ